MNLLHSSSAFLDEAQPNAARHLEAGSVDNLHVDGHLTTVVGDDEDTNAAAARLESLLEAVPEAALVNDGQVLLDVTSLSHGDDGTILHVEDAVLLENGAEHGLDNDARGGVGDKGRLLMELLGEEVDTEVTVLTGGSRGRDADDLARAALEDEDITKANVVAGDGHGVGGVGILRRRHTRATAGLASLGHLDAVMAFRVQDTVSKLVESMTERVVVSVLVVVTHLGFLSGGRRVTGSVDGLFGELDVRLVEGGTRAGRIDSRLADADRLLVDGGVAGSVDGGLVDADGVLKGGTVGRAVNGGADYVDFVTVVGLETGAVFTLGNVDDGVVRAVRLVDLNAGFGVGRLRSGSVLFTVVLLTDAGTAVSFLFTSDVDLFFTEASLRARREFDLGLERRVLTFPSGVLGGLDL
jgi:hypothetical protein